MDIEAVTATGDPIRITLDAREAYLLKVALERACYLDTKPEDQNAALQMAEQLIDLLVRVERESDK